MAHRLIRIVLLLLAVACFTLPANAQAAPTAETLTEISIFLTHSLVDTDYAGPLQTGLSAGTDYTVYLPKLALGASIEGRASYTPVVSYVGQRVVSAGFRFESTRFRTIRPYGNFLAGAGKIYYIAPPNASDRCVVFTFGGGFDFDLAPRLSAKIEAEGSRWRPDPTIIRYPTMLNFGLVYRLPIVHGFAH